MKKIAILGSTGSIGTQTLDVVRANGDIQVLGISAGRNINVFGVFLHRLWYKESKLLMRSHQC